MKKTSFYFIALFLMVLNASLLSQTIISWGGTGTFTSGGPVTWTPATANASLTVGPLTKGATMVTSVTSPTPMFGGSNFPATPPTTLTSDFTFTATPNPGSAVSFSTMSFVYRRSSISPSVIAVEYAIGGSSTTYTTITTFSNVSSNGMSTTGTSTGPILLTGIAALQSVQAGTVVKFRIQPYGPIGAGGAMGFVSSNALVVTGSIVPVVAGLSASVSVASPVLCNGQANGALTVTPNGGNGPYTYSWMPTGGTLALAQNLAAGIYSCLVTDMASTTTIATYSLAAPPAVSLSVAAQSSVSCFGGADASATVAATGGSGAYTYSWSPAGGTTVIGTNLMAATYTAMATDANGCSTSQTIAIAGPLTMPAISATTNTSSVCNGGTLTLTGGGATSYTWAAGITDGAPFTPTASGSYSVIGTLASGCTGTAAVSITVNPTPTITVNSGAICPGANYVLFPGGASTYTISGGTATVMPTATTDYSVYGTSAAGCAAAAPAIATVAVAGSVSVSISGSSGICTGQAATLTASGASSYTWDSGDQTYTITPSPTVNTTYTVTGASGTCSNTAMMTVTVNPLPVVSASGASVVCNGSSTTLTAGGAYTYSWSSGALTSTLAVSPTVATIYTVTGTDANGCSNATTISLGVNPVPTITVPNGTVCAGTSFTLSPTGASTYTFSSGNVVTPSVTTSYSVTGANSLGCVSPVAGVVTIYANAIPNITVNSGNLCTGSVYTLNPSGALTYTFSSGSATVSPTVTTSYSVTGTSSLGCISASAAIATVSVSSSPTITVNSASLCSGSVFTMMPSGAATYTFSNGSPTVVAIVNHTYTVIGSNTAGCVSAPVTASLTVGTPPTVTVNSGAICAGSSFTLVPGGASTYTITGGSTVVSPTTTTSYSVSGTNLGCVSVNNAVATITVSSGPTITVNSGSVCAGQAFTIVPSGAATYTVSGGLTTVSPTTTATYSIIGTNSIGCTSATPVISTVAVVSSPTIAATSTAICKGSSALLFVSGAGSYSWSTGFTSAGISVTPAVSTNYTVTGTTGICSSSVVASVSVNPIPTVSISGGNICPGGSFTLNPSGAATYTYSSGQVVSPSTTASYSVTGTSSAGCVSASAAVAVITVSNSIVVSASGNTLICDGQPANITASGASTYTWSTGDLTATIAPTPSANIIYTVNGASGTCSNTAVISVSVLPNPNVLVASGTVGVCDGQTAILTATGASTYTWTGGISNGVAFTPTATGSYTVTGSDGNCTSIAVATVSVFSNPTITISGTTTACAGQTAVVTATGASTYTWSGGISNGVAFMPSVTSAYTVTGTSADNCSNTAVATVSVSSNPTVAAIASNSAVCAGQTASLVASGATTYSWTNGISNGTAFTPTSTATYSVIGADANGCQGSTAVMIVVNPQPTLTTASSHSTICAGETVSLSAGGAATYSWSSGQTTMIISVSPIVLTSYTVSGTDINGCSSSAVVLQDVSTCTGLKELSSSANVFIYPNPNNGSFNIRADFSARFTLSNELGQTVLTVDHEASAETRLNGLEPGIYFLSGAYGNAAVKEKIVVTR